MRPVRQLCCGLILVTVGYLAGAAGARWSGAAQAQEESETVAKVRAANTALNAAADALKADGAYEAITQGVNAFLVLSGGGNARQDLENGAAVDPETFAALYAGQGLPEIQELLSRDDEGRLTYNGLVVRMYSKQRLQQLYTARVRLTGGVE
jgi:hypothetical protein